MNYESQLAPVKATVTRRQFLRLALTSAEYALFPALFPPLPAAHNTADIQAWKRESALNSETTALVDEPIIVEYQPGTQKVLFKQVDKNHYEPVGCQPPVVPHQEYGFQDLDHTLYSWEKHAFNSINTPQGKLLVLKSDNLPQNRSQALESWFQNPNYINEQIQGLNLPELKPKTIPCLVIDYRSTRNDYWTEDAEGKCTRITDTSSEYDTQLLFAELNDMIASGTRGQIQYTPKDTLIWTEADHPLTDNPKHTFQDLIDSDHRTLNYAKVAKEAIHRKAETVFVFAGDNGGMYEQVYWTDEKTGKVVNIFGLNFNRASELALHSWLHFVEDSILFSGDDNLIRVFHEYTGRMEEYITFPYNDIQSLQSQRDVAFMLNSETQYKVKFAAPGYGTVHLPPNGLNHYDYNSPVDVYLPDKQEPVNANTWGNDQKGYLQWWLNNLPLPFLSKIN